MSNLTCPKCGGSDYFMSQRNVVKGMGWAQRGSIKSIPVCRLCDEIMSGAQVGLKNWEDYGPGRASARNSKKILLPLLSIPFSILIVGGYVFSEPRLIRISSLFVLLLATLILLLPFNNKSKLVKGFFSIFLVGTFFLAIEFQSMIGGIFGIIAYSTFLIGSIGTAISLIMSKKV